MKKWGFQIIVLFALLFFCPQSPFSAQDRPDFAIKTASEQLLDQAQDILSNLTSTRYSHRTTLNESAGIYHVDCSALLCFLLSRAAPQALKEVAVDPSHSHARAINFYSTLANAPTYKGEHTWQKITRLADAEPGDIIAWRKDPLPSKGNTGHVLLILEKPVEEEDGTIRVSVLDSSRSRHSQDTRPKDSGGIGSGVMWFQVAPHGAPVAFHWSSKKKPAVYLPIAIGRVVEAASRGPKTYR